MQDNLDSDKRIFQRTRVQFPIEVIDPQRRAPVNAKCADISAGGIGLVTEKQIPIGKTVNLSLQLPDTRQSYNVRAKAVWEQEIGKGLWRMGLSFHDIELFKHWRIFKLPGVRKPIF